MTKLVYIFNQTSKNENECLMLRFFLLEKILIYLFQMLIIKIKFKYKQDTQGKVHTNNNSSEQEI